MTALKEYQRLETTGLWRSAPEEQRREVAVCLGDVTLLITDLQDRVLAHWSLDAICRQNPGTTPARYYPRGNPGETLEISEPQMVDAIAKLHDTIERSRPHPGRLRRLIIWTFVIAVLGFLFIGLPRIVHQQALRSLPPVALRETGQQLLTQTARMTGMSCENPATQPVLEALSQRFAAGGFNAPRLVVASEGFDSTVVLPGDIILINRTLIENQDSPDVLAGYLVAEQVRSKTHQPMQAVLDNAGLTATLRLISGGTLPKSATEKNARALLLTAPEWPEAGDMMAGFEALQISPDAYLRAVTGKAPDDYATIHLTGQPRPVLSDADWLRLQTICDQ